MIDSTSTAARLAKTLNEYHAESSWRGVAWTHYQNKIGHATLSRIAKSGGKWIPKSRKLRRLLGLISPCDGSPCRGCQALKEFRAKRK